MSGFLKSIEALLWGAAMVLVFTIVMWGILHYGEKYLPGALGQFVGAVADRATKEGWE